MYEGSAKLPGGHFLTVDLTTFEIKVEAYWRFVVDPDEDLAARGDDELAEELRHLLLQAVDRRLVSDVPVGIFLSGGLDSSGVLAAAARFRPASTLNTFTIGFTETSYDESEFALTAAKHVGSHHNQRILDLEQARNLIPDVLSRLDEPLGDPSIVPTYLLCAFARAEVTVALSGDGGDELFAGYDPFRALRLASVYNRLMPKTLHCLLREVAALIPKSSRNMSMDFKIRRTLMGLSQPESAWAPVWMAPLDPDNAKDLFDEPMRAEDVYSEAMELWETGPAKTRIDRLLQFFTLFYLQDDILTKVDRASMMSSLETRAIFLDNDLVDFCRRLPHRFKYRNGQRKFLLKKALEPLLPASIIRRQKKGFGIPLADWMRQMPETVPLVPVAGMRLKWLEQAWQDHRSKREDHRLLLWMWFSLQNILQPALQGSQ